MIYHPFIYKTILCPKVNNKINSCTKENCFYAHNFNEDFRLLPLVIKEEINEIIMYCLKNQLFGFKTSHLIAENIAKIKNLTKDKNFSLECAKEILVNIINKEFKKVSYNILPSEFNPLTYKIFKCPLRSECKLDQNLCLNYHDYNDKRRNPEEIKYGEKYCKHIFNKETRKFRNSKHCPDVNINFFYF